MVSNDRPTVFIHTNHRQMLGALVSQYSMKRNASNPDEFDVQLIDHADHAFFKDYEGREYLRDGASRVWRNNDLQSFTPLRFMPPELMGYQGRAVVTDPDVFAVGDVMELRDDVVVRVECREDVESFWCETWVGDHRTSETTHSYHGCVPRSIEPENRTKFAF